MLNKYILDENWVVTLLRQGCGLIIYNTQSKSMTLVSGGSWPKVLEGPE